ncbi:MAG TPA: hypothetical protein VG734_01760 [Lacunisphaera sp.]|nr:hypothetical protein [Lacunisphaera sp.]
MFWVGSAADFQTVAIVVGGGVGVCFLLEAALWATTRSRHRKLAADYVRLYGPLPEETKAWGTRAGGTAGRLVGGSTGYLVGGLVGAAVDVYNEQAKYRDMSEPQLALLHELGQLKLVQPLLISLFMFGALIGSWLLVVAADILRGVFGW